jgi:hypothetical protein
MMLAIGPYLPSRYLPSLVSVATWQLTPAFASRFNASVIDTNGVQFSILAGDALVTTCGEPGDSDLVVPVTSALWAGLPFTHERIDLGLVHTSMTSSYPVFSTWVAPLLEVGFASDGDRLRRASRTETASITSATRAKPKAKRKLRCNQASSSLGTIAAGGATTVTHGIKMFRMRIGPAQNMTVTVFSSEPIAVRLLNGSGRVVDSSTASRSSGPSFESWTINHPPSGGWKLSINAPAGSTQIAYFVTQIKPAVALSARLSQNARGQVLLTAQLVRRGRPLARARVTGSLISGAGRRLRVRLTPAPRHPGLYRLTRKIRLAAPTAAGGLEAALAATGPGYSVSTVASDVVSCDAATKH